MVWYITTTALVSLLGALASRLLQAWASGPCSQDDGRAPRGLRKCTRHADQWCGLVSQSIFEAPEDIERGVPTVAAAAAQFQSAINAVFQANRRAAARRAVARRGTARRGATR